MSDTKVKLPDLSPSEYRLLVDALKFFHENEKAVALSAGSAPDWRSLKNKARANATELQNLLDRIGF